MGRPVSCRPMRASHLFARTLREAPAEAEVASHRLLLRAGYIRQADVGRLHVPPARLADAPRIEAIIREEMDATGAQEIRMPIVLPAEPWKATGRWDVYGELMFKLRDRHGRELGLGPTQEEVVTPLVADELTSYRDLPVNLYQVEWKYRDEYRPRFGLLRGREFLMKDAYSFDRDEPGMRVRYDAMVRPTGGSSTGAAWTTGGRGRPGADRRRREPRVPGGQPWSARTCSWPARTGTTWPTWRPPRPGRPKPASRRTSSP